MSTFLQNVCSIILIHQTSVLFWAPFFSSYIPLYSLQTTVGVILQLILLCQLHDCNKASCAMLHDKMMNLPYKSWLMTPLPNGKKRYTITLKTTTSMQLCNYACNLLEYLHAAEERILAATQQCYALYNTCRYAYCTIANLTNKTLNYFHNTSAELTVL